MRLGLVLLVASASTALSQASPYLPLDHPAMPLVEWLIARGELRDPSPQIRPLRVADILAALDRQEASPKGGSITTALRSVLERPRSDAWFRVAPAAGAQAFTAARRDPIHPGGDGGVRGYGEVGLEGVFGNLVVASRPMAENRLKLDPDWAGGGIQRTKSQAYRFAEGYLSAQFKHVRLWFGQMDRNWGPTGSLGLSIANYGYPRTDLALEIPLRDIQVQLLGASLPAMRSSDGTDHRRYFLAHRLSARLSSRLDVALWETMIVSGSGGSSPTAGTFNPLVLFSFPIQLGLPDQRNTIIGGDLTWRVGSGLRLQGQAMVDDRWRTKPDSVTGEDRHPGRWAVTLAGSGPLGQRLAWRAAASVVNALAYRTTDSAQSFLDRGIGIGPHFTDLVRFDARVELPVRDQWLVAPELAVAFQGQGRIDRPFPVGPELRNTPELLIGTVERTWRLGLSVAGAERGLGVQAAAGWQQTTNASHLAGRQRSGIEARIQATIGTSFGGVLR